tara:strand:- start:71 stop:211 length:141 start_codon:yes stop_codon:yes gene_type:complete
VGEHFVDIEGVTGSIPVTPTMVWKIVEKGNESKKFLEVAKAASQRL